MTSLRDAVQEFIADYDCGGCGHFQYYAERFRELLAQQEDIAQNLQSRLDAAFLLEERRQEIAQPRREGEQEPVAWRTFDGEGGWDYCAYADNEHYRDNYIKRNGEKYASWVEPLYSAPPRREWRSLSEEEIALIDWENLKTRKDAVRAVEARLRELNHG